MAQKGIIKNSTSADIGASELADIFLALLGVSGIIKAYSDLACTKVNDNTVQLAAGVYNLSGYLLEVAKATTVNLTIASGSAGQNRNDMVVAEFVRNGGGAGIDTLQFKIVQGTSTSGTPADPTLTQQDINGAGVTRQEALWRVKIVGTTLSTIEAVASIVKPQLAAGGASYPFDLMPYVGTAPIVESGSNANGSYVKFADGTMICAHDYAPAAPGAMNAIGSIYYAAINLPNFPVAFDAAPKCTKTLNTNGGSYAWMGGSTAAYVSTTNPGDVTIFTATSSPPTIVRIAYIAIGRWKA